LSHNRIIGLLICLATVPSTAQPPGDVNQANHPTFIENKGQIIDQNNRPNPAVLYLLNTPGMNVQLRRGGFSYDLYRISINEFRMMNWLTTACNPNNPGPGIRHRISNIQRPTSNITELISTSSAPTQTARSLQQELLPITRTITPPGRRLKE
jgi:hypothetical protein